MSVQNSPQLPIEPILQPIIEEPSKKAEQAPVKLNGHSYVINPEQMSKRELKESIAKVETCVTQWKGDLEKLKGKQDKFDAQIMKALDRGEAAKADRIRSRAFSNQEEIKELRQLIKNADTYVNSSKRSAAYGALQEEMFENIQNGSLSPEKKNELLLGGNGLNPKFIQDLSREVMTKIQKDEIPFDHAMNTLQFIKDYLKDGFDLPADSASQKSMYNAISELTKQVKSFGDFEATDLCNEVNRFALKNLNQSNLSNKEISTQGSFVLSQLSKSNSKNQNVAIDQALKYCSDTRSNNDIEVKQVRAQIQDKLKSLTANYDITKLPAQQIANDIHVTFEKLFMQMQGNEFNSVNWEKNDQTGLAPNVVEYTKASVHLTSTFVDKLNSLSKTNPKEAVKLYNTLIDAAKIAWNNNNITGTEIIATALNDVQHLRLNKSLNEQKKKDLDEVLHLSSDRKSINKKFVEARTQNKVVVPSLPTIANLLIFSSEGNKESPENLLEINAKIKSTIKITHDILKGQSQAAQLSPERGSHLLRAQLAVRGGTT